MASIPPQNLVFRHAEQCSFDLPRGEIHIWRIPLAISEERRKEVFAWLSEEERRRAGRFVFEPDRVRFIACRGALREILGGYLTCDPQSVVFRYGKHGKPGLETQVQAPLWFNVSHSHDLALAAVSCGGEIGIDLEHLRSVEEAQAIARRYFTPREFEKIEQHPPEERIAAFFRCWTRKEALLKAIGVGLGFSLDQLEVSVEGDSLPQLRWLGVDLAIASQEWRLYHVEPAPDYVGAVAAPGDQESLVGWQARD